MTVLNKWNGNKYKVVNTTDKTVVLERENKSQFEISKSEYFFSYVEFISKK